MNTSNDKHIAGNVWRTNAVLEINAHGYDESEKTSSVRKHQRGIAKRPSLRCECYMRNMKIYDF